MLNDTLGSSLIKWFTLEAFNNDQVLKYKFGLQEYTNFVSGFSALTYLVVITLLLSLYCNHSIVINSIVIKLFVFLFLFKLICLKMDRDHSTV
jgi:hypothetical protein